MVGGPESELPDLSPYTSSGADWIGVDGGAKYLLERGIPMIKAMGDFDSLSESELASLKEHVADVSEFPAEKDLTDTEIGLLFAMEKKAGFDSDFWCNRRPDGSFACKFDDAHEARV